jgi:hypothetical protein
MTITQNTVAEQLAAYLRHEIGQVQLVDWAERQVMDGEFESTVVRDAVARLGVADVRAFGLTWEDCERLLKDMGFTAHIDIEAA